MIEDLSMGSEIDNSIGCREEDIQKRIHYYGRYQRLLDSTINRAENIAQAVQNILILVVEKDPKLSVKYKILVTTTCITAMFGGCIIIGLTVAHLLPCAICPFILPVAGVAAMIVTAVGLGLITSWVIYKAIQSKRFDWKARMGDLSEAFSNTLAKYFPFLVRFFSYGHDEKATNDQLRESLLKQLQCMRVDELTWLDNQSLMDFKGEIEATLIELHQDHRMFEESCSSAA
jgi:hypothetical protein